MSYREYEPHPALRSFVDRFWTREGSGSGQTVHILPDGCIDVLCDLASAHAFVVGTMTRAQSFEEPDGLSLVAVRFRPGGAIPFLSVAADELTDHDVDCADLGLFWLSAAALSERSHPKQAVRRLELALLERASRVRAPDGAIAHAVRLLLGSGAHSVTTVARDLGWTRQHLRRVFRTQVGLGPKELAKIGRLQRAVATVQAGCGTLAEAAASAGYSDEAHMHRDFRQLVGVTPREVRRQPGSIRPIRSLFDEA